MDTNPETFELLDAVNSGITYPSTTTVVYLDQASMQELAELELAQHNLADDDARNALHDRQKELIKAVEDSRLTVSMTAIPQTKAGAIYRHEVAVQTDPSDINIKVLSATVTKITNAKGATANFDSDGVFSFLQTLPPDQLSKILEAHGIIMGEGFRDEAILTDPSFS